MNFINKYIFSTAGIITIFVLNFDFGWRHFIIPSASMEPTMMTGDIYFGNMHKYGINRPSILGIDPFGVNREFTFNEPKVGDVIIFQKGGRKMIKRIFASGGDFVEIDGSNNFYRNGELDNSNAFFDKNASAEFKAQLTAMDAGKMPMALVGDKFTYKVPEGEFFVLGDNRNHSKDSRFIGAIKSESIIGGPSLTVINPKGGNFMRNTF